MLRGITVKAFDSRFRTEVANRLATVGGIGFELCGYTRKRVFFAHRCTDNDANSSRRIVSDHRSTIVSKPILDARIDDLKTGGVPAVFQYEISRALEVAGRHALLIRRGIGVYLRWAVNRSIIALHEVILVT